MDVQKVIQSQVYGWEYSHYIDHLTEEAFDKLDTAKLVLQMVKAIKTLLYIEKCQQLWYNMPVSVHHSEVKSRMDNLESRLKITWEGEL
jgi:hypothetical protein